MNVPIGQAPTITSDELMWQIWMGAFRLPSVAYCDRIGLFAAAERPVDECDLIKHLGIQPTVGSTLVSILVGLGLMARYGTCVSLTSTSRTYLLPSSPYYWGALLRLVSEFPLTQTAIADAVESWNRRADLAEENGNGHRAPAALSLLSLGTKANVGGGIRQAFKLYNEAMHSQSFSSARVTARQHDFSDIHRLLDVGGGSGCFAIALTERYPGMCVTVMDMPIVCDMVLQRTQHLPSFDRISVLARDMFREQWPSGYDGVLLSNILHDWGPESRRRLIASSFSALPTHGRLYLNEMLLDDSMNGPLDASCFSLNMILFSGGSQLTAREIQTLLTETGFRDIAFENSHGYYCLVSATKP